MSEPIRQQPDEWTVATVEAMLEEPRTFPRPYGPAVIAAARNAERAAEREHVAALQRLEGTLQEQLAAERENNDAQADAYVRRIKELNKQLADNDEQWKEKVDQLQAQLSDNDEGWKNKLAAERKITFAAQQAALKEGIRSGELERQHAAAVEALEMLRDYQNGCPLPSYEKGWNEAMRLTDAALAKIGEKQ